MVTTSPVPHPGWKPRLSRARAGPRPQAVSVAGLVPTSPPSPDLPDALRAHRGSSSVCWGVASGGAQGPPHPGGTGPPSSRLGTPPAQQEEMAVESTAPSPDPELGEGTQSWRGPQEADSRGIVTKVCFSNKVPTLRNKPCEERSPGTRGPQESVGAKKPSDGGGLP